MNNNFTVQIKYFIESIEPDLLYNGYDGLINFTIESTENLYAINNFIESAEEDKENFLVRGAKTVGGWIKKAFEAIYKFIKKIISKIKGLFMNLLHKLKIMYAKALEKIGKFLKEKINDKDNRATVEWYQLQPTAFDRIAAYSNDLSEDMLNGLGNSRYTDILVNSYHYPTIPTLENLKKDNKVFKLIKSERITKSQFDNIFNGTIISNLNKAYNNIQKINAAALKSAHDAEKECEQYKNDDDKDKAKKICKATTKVVKEVNNIEIQYMNKMFSVAIFAFHQALKAVLFGLKGTAGAKIRSGKDKFGTKLHQVARKLDSDEPIHNSADLVIL